MAVYLSPGVYPREIDLSLVATGAGPLFPALIGAAKKGPMNTPTLITNAAQYIDTFGDPFPEAYLGYAVLAYLEEGQQCYVERVGVELEEGQVEELYQIAIDTSGARVEGWGRIPVFTGIDYGKIPLRTPSVDAPLSFHTAAVLNINFNDVDPSGGTTTATLTFTGSDCSDAYTGVIDETFTILLTSSPSPSGGSVLDGAEYSIIRNSDGAIIGTGTISESTTPGESEPIDIGTGVDATGLTCRIIVTGLNPLEEGDSFTFEARPDNRTFGFSPDREAVTPHLFNDGESFTTTDAFVARFNVIIGGGEDYVAVNMSGVPVIRTDVAGESLQLMQSEAWALECGQSLYAWDIPRSYLIATDAGPFNITTANDRIKMDVIGSGSTTTIEFSMPQGLNQNATQVAAALHVNGLYMGTRYWKSYALQVTDDEYRVVIETDYGFRFAMLELVANASNPETLKFAEELEIQYPYKRNYRGFSDERVELPASGTITPEDPLSCEIDPGSAQCALDSAYYQNIVGWFVAPSAGTWINDYKMSLQVFTDGVGDVAGRYEILILDKNNLVTDRVQDVSFDKRDDRYVGSVVNPGSKYGGVNGDAYMNWEERPSWLANDPAASDFEVRLPSEYSNKEFAGAANGIPTDPIYSSELDRRVIGNPALSTGIFAFQNPEAYDINLLATPGFSSGAVIGQCLQMCQSRGDVLYIVDPPYGLRPQQVVDWHNGMLLSDLSQAINSSYGALYWSWLKIFDQFGGEEIWIPPSGHQLSVFARTARDGEQWFAPAGLNRGRLLTPLDIEYNPTLGERNLLYGSGNAVNPIVKFTQEGITVWGQRTLQRKPSALDRVNVRMLLIYLKKNLIRILRYMIFEQNDDILWRSVVNVINPFLGDVAARRGLDAFKVVCDATNNTPERRARNELWVSVFLKPTLVAEFVVLNLVILRTDASFSAEEVLAAGGVVTRT